MDATYILKFKIRDLRTLARRAMADLNARNARNAQNARNPPQARKVLRYNYVENNKDAKILYKYKNRYRKLSIKLFHFHLCIKEICKCFESVFLYLSVGKHFNRQFLILKTDLIYPRILGASRVEF